MTNRNLEKALDIVSELIMGRAVDKDGDNATLYQEYQNNSEVYDMFDLALGPDLPPWASSTISGMFLSWTSFAIASI